MARYRFVMTGGGTGGHVFPALAIARILSQRGHDLRFIGTSTGMEARLVPEAGYPIDFIRIGGFNRVGLSKQIRTSYEMPLAVLAASRMLRRYRPQAVFSMGGFVAGPVVVAALLHRIALVVMEPNAVPGITNRKIARWVYRALVGFKDTARWFPPGKTEVTGLPVREGFFRITPKTGGIFTLLITGGSRGARTLNRAARESWPFFHRHQTPIRIIHQTGAAEHEVLLKAFAESGVQGEVIPFIHDMPEMFSQADLVVGRAGAGGTSEIAAAGMPSILVPLPFAADDHQRKNAEALVDAGAARIVLDRDLTGERLFHEVELLRNHPEQREAMRNAVRQFAHPGAAERGADVLEEAASRKNAWKA